MVASPKPVNAGDTVKSANLEESQGRTGFLDYLLAQTVVYIVQVVKNAI
jgi:hypothetical protein